MPGGPVVIRDPEGIRMFASQLNEFNSELAEHSARLEAQFQRLGEVWQDPAYARFADEFRHMTANLRRFRQASEPVVPDLLKLYERARSVHQ
jgi:uncharacterized protein YukE